MKEGKWASRQESVILGKVAATLCQAEEQAAKSKRANQGVDDPACFLKHFIGLCLDPHSISYLTRRLCWLKGAALITTRPFQQHLTGKGNPRAMRCSE